MPLECFSNYRDGAKGCSFLLYTTCTCYMYSTMSSDLHHMRNASAGSGGSNSGKNFSANRRYILKFSRTQPFTLDTLVMVEISLQFNEIVEGAYRSAS